MVIKVMALNVAQVQDTHVRGELTISVFPLSPSLYCNNQYGDTSRTVVMVILLFYYYSHFIIFSLQTAKTLNIVV